MPDRSFRAFCAAVGRQPGSRLMLVGIACLGTKSVLSSGFAGAGIALAVGIVLGIATGYPRFRRTGWLPGRRRSFDGPTS